MAKSPAFDLKSLVASEISLAKDASDTLSQQRAKALEYYYGEMADTPAPANRSSMVRRIVAETVDKMMPAIVRTFLASGRMFEYEPQSEGDEEVAEQASDLSTYVFFKDNDGYKNVYSATFDALLHGDAIVKTYWEKKEDYSEHEFTGLTQEALALLDQDPNVEILEQEAEEGFDPLTGQPIAIYEVKVKRIKSKGYICIECIPPEDFLIDNDATCVDDARFVAHRAEVTRSDLIEMGFDRDQVEALPGDRGTADFEPEKNARDDQYWGKALNVDSSTDIVELYECYIKYDLNDDGKSEMVKVYYAGTGEGGNILSLDGDEYEEWSGPHPFDAIPCEPVPHRWNSQSIAEKIMPLQRLATVLTRAALDNIYSHNNPQPIIEEDSVINMDALTSPKFGMPVIRKKNAQSPVEWRVVPYVGSEIFQSIEYAEKLVVEQTGMSGMSAALDPETLQNQSATAAQLQHDIQYSRAELVARNMAEGWRKVGRKILKLLVANQDRERTIRLRNKFVTMDPRDWNADMDCTVNVGLGTGSRDRDLAMLNVILQSQYMMTQAAAGYGYPEVALEMLPKIVKTLEKQGEAAGIRNADEYYPEFSPEKLQQMLQKAMQPREDPKIALEKAKIEAKQQGDMQKMQIDAKKAEQDAQIKAASATLDAQLSREEAIAKMRLEEQQLEAELQLKREQLVAELALQEQQMRAEMAMKRELGYHTANVNGAAKVASSNVRLGGEPG